MKDWNRSERRQSVTCACLIFLIVTFSPAAVARSQGNRPRPRKAIGTRPHTLVQLKRQIRELLNRPEFIAASIGIHIATRDDEKVLFDHNGDKLLTPASNMKLYTTAAALEGLGPEFRIKTSIYAASTPDATGRISGDLTFYGRGDPSFASRYHHDSSVKPYELLAKQLVTAGVKKIEGNLIADESYLSGDPHGQGWEWMDLQWHFGAEVSALSTNDNCIEVSVRPGSKVGEPCTITITPDVGYISFINRTQTVDQKGRQDIGINRGLADNNLLVWGQMPVNDPGFHARVAVYRPAGLAASLLKSALNAAGIAITGEIKIADASLRSNVQPAQIERDKLIELAAIESPPLSELVRVVNKFSHNLYAELLLRVLGKIKGPYQKESDIAGVEIIKEMLNSAGIDTSPLEITDGSGLSRRSLVSAAATAKLLSYVSRRPYNEVYLNSLPVAGSDGTLTRRMTGTSAAQNTRAKTGTLSNTSTLSGYIETAAGEPLVFSILVNHFTDNFSRALELQNKICALLAEFTGKLD
jgi:serine-type D-Ala-D-Ala carboxypeptidase/endopeptidase (penicillin-binding protein 4)